jgi:dUTP pyrophosphatase
MEQSDYPLFTETLYSKGSHKKCRVTCTLQVSEKCSGTVVRTYRDVWAGKDRNNGVYMCLYCSRREKFSGRQNPNVRYHTLNDSLFSEINSEELAYVLGWIASDGSLSKTGFTIAIHYKDSDCLNRIRDIICRELPVKEKSGTTLVSLTVNSAEIAKDVCRHLSIDPAGETFTKSHNVCFPRHIAKQLWPSFIRGYFDGDGSISMRGHKGVTASIASCSTELLQDIKTAVGLKCWLGSGQIQWYGENAVLFLDYIYDSSWVHLSRKFDLYVECLERRFEYIQKAVIKIARDHPNAIMPSKAHASDSGFDVTVVDVHKKLPNGVTLFKTGLRLAPNPGYYTDLVARSSLMKYGYMLANGVGVIDNSYRGPLLVALLKFDPEASDLTLPLRVAQLIPRKIIDVEVKEVDKVDDTMRGDGGFGSTGK